MTKLITFPLIVTACVIASACFTKLSARDEAPSNWRSLEQRYAEANLELAQSRLDMAQTQNKAVPGTIAKQTMNELHSAVQVARDWIKQLAVNQNPNRYSPQVAAMEGVIRSLEANHAESINANQLQDGAVSTATLRNEQAEIDVAKARLAALRALAQQPPEVRIEWEIRMLQDDIRALWARPLIQD
jgi:hypothetical protein